MSPIYRIRGLSAIAPAKFEPTAEEANPETLLAQMLRAMDRPHITDILFRAKSLQRLSKFWPTLAYIRPRTRGMALKEAPVHLYPFIDYSSSDTTSRDIVRVAEAQEKEEKAIEALLWALSERDTPVVCQFPLTMAMASALFRGSAWLKKHREEILHTILGSASASFIAILSGVWQGDLAALLEASSEDPRLVLELSQNPVLANLTSETRFLEHLKPHPVQFAAKLFLTSKSKEALAVLRQAAESNATIAGICLGLTPYHRKADNWLATINGNAEAVYWMGRVLKAGGKDVTTHANLATTRSVLRRAPRWHYLWIRDVAPEEAIHCVKEIWPSPWAPEAFVDLGLSKDLALDLYNSQPLDPKDPLQSAILLWASDFTAPSQS